MSTDVTTDVDRPVTFSGLQQPKAPGLHKLSAGATVFLLLSIVVFMALLVLNFWIALGWAIVTLVLLAPAAIPTRDGYGRYAKGFRRLGFNAGERSGRNTLVQGLTGNVPDGQCRLPGLGAAATLHSCVDSHHRPFGLIEWGRNIYSVVIQCFPEGFGNQEKRDNDAAVAQWGAYLAALNRYSEIVGASVTVEASPDSGKRLNRAVLRGRVDEAESNEFSRTVTDQIRQQYSVGSPKVSAWVTLTFSGRADKDEDGATNRTCEEMIDLISGMLPGLTGDLGATGAGSGARPSTTQQIIDSTRVAYDPSVAELVEEAQLGDGTGLTWDQVGPTHAVNAYDYYEHEGYVSRTWQMREAPSGVFYAETLKRLLEPHHDVPRKRITLLYRPETPQASRVAAERGVKSAGIMATQSRRAAATARVKLRDAERTAEQEALGSPLVRVGLVATVTAPAAASLARASRVLRGSLSSGARINLRLPKAAQDMAFLTALPLGIVPPVQLRNPYKAPGE